MKLHFYDDRIEIWKENIIGNIRFPSEIISIKKFSDFPKNILNELSEDEQEQVYWFFLDLDE